MSSMYSWLRMVSSAEMGPDVNFLLMGKLTMDLPGV